MNRSRSQRLDAADRGVDRRSSPERKRAALRGISPKFLDCDPSELLTAAEFAELVGISKARAYQLLDQFIPHLNINGKRWFTPMSVRALRWYQQAPGRSFVHFEPEGAA